MPRAPFGFNLEYDGEHPFTECMRAHSDKEDPGRYCGWIKAVTEGGKHHYDPEAKKRLRQPRGKWREDDAKKKKRKRSKKSIYKAYLAEQNPFADVPKYSSKISKSHRRVTKDNSQESVSRFVVGVNIGDRTTDKASKIRLQKSAQEDRFTLTVLYRATNDESVPDLDAHNDFVVSNDIQRALWNYVDNSDRNIYLQHKRSHNRIAGRWVEIFVWPHEVEAEFKMTNGKIRKSVIPANSAWMGVIWEPWAWDMVKSGEITGLSFGGDALVEDDD